jgi:hypothetical protein
MQPSSSSPAPAPTPTATEVVTRPDPGLARGKWEAPVWLFWVVLALVLVGSAAYLLRRLGILRRPEKNESASPPSTKMRRP